MRKKVVFITGGARSGKSSFALTEALKIKGKKAYIATAEALDEEMKEKIERHKKDRGNGWDTYEEPVRLPETINKIRDRYNVIVLDCLTLWLSNLIMNEKDLEREIESLCLSFNADRCTLFIVSNEVGMGIVPENEMARRFRDLAGMINQKIAGIADEVYMIISGIHVRIK